MSYKRNFLSVSRCHFFIHDFLILKAINVERIRVCVAIFILVAGYSCEARKLELRQYKNDLIA